MNLVWAARHRTPGDHDAGKQSSGQGLRTDDLRRNGYRISFLSPTAVQRVARLLPCGYSVNDADDSVVRCIGDCLIGRS
ncbi:MULTISPECIES: hypothetical protein [unclassified Pseudomonas]|uniref:hypothetical protein n=1 Tax=unclassified Pseudomonas TaxID=196821 RepID=UPI0025E097AC|nr:MULTISPECIES: hypothetical protein [unclassified Pseudomonas]